MQTFYYTGTFSSIVALYELQMTDYIELFLLLKVDHIILLLHIYYLWVKLSTAYTCGKPLIAGRSKTAAVWIHTHIRTK